MSSADETVVVAFSTVQQHSRQDDAWAVIHELVYDLSSFVGQHPGGVAILLPWLGRDATLAFDQHHNSQVLSLVRGSVVGRIDVRDRAWLDDVAAQRQAAATRGDDLAARRAGLPPLDDVLNMHDFEAAAERAMEPAGWAYYSSAADDEASLRENRAAFGRVWIRPRVLVDVSRIDTSTTLLGSRCSLPLYVSATALARLADPAGEVALSRGCAAQQVVYMAPTLGSCSLDEIAAARLPDQTHWFQLYVNADRALCAQLVRRAEALGCRALFVTVDAPALGRREKDMRFKAAQRSHVQQQRGHQVDSSAGTAKSLSAFIDPSLNWSDLQWLAGLSSMPLCLKGVQCAEDAVLAARHGVKAIVISNHGARQVDYARSAIEVLPECIAALTAAGLRHTIQVYIDGGVRRGTDIFKALALGADAVGIGRPTLYALAAYGEPGVSRCLHMLRDEFLTCLRMAGCTSVADIRPSMVSAAKL